MLPSVNLKETVSTRKCAKDLVRYRANGTNNVAREFYINALNP